jgi:ribosomal protein S30
MQTYDRLTKDGQVRSKTPKHIGYTKKTTTNQIESPSKTPITIT